MDKKIMRILALSALLTSLVFSLSFFISQNLMYALVFTLLELTKITILMLTRYSAKSKVLCVILCVVASTFSIFATVANSYNSLEDAKIASFEEAKNPKYVQYINKINRLDIDIQNTNKELQNYPTLDNYRGIIPSWLADKRVEITKEWEIGKQKLVDKKDKSQKEKDLLIVPDKTIKIRTKEKKGYVAVFEVLKIENIELYFSFSFAIILEFLIYICATLSRTHNMESNLLEEVRSNNLTDTSECKIMVTNHNLESNHVRTHNMESNPNDLTLSNLRESSVSGVQCNNMESNLLEEVRSQEMENTSMLQNMDSNPVELVRTHNMESNLLEEILELVRTHNMESNQVLNKKIFNLEWKKVKKLLLENDLAYIKGTKLFLK